VNEPAIYQAFVRFLGEDVEAVEHALMNGQGIGDWPAYKARLGERKGLIRAQERLKEAMKKGLSDNDEEDL